MGCRIIEGDAWQELLGMPDASVDAVVTDPPYGVSFQSRVRPKAERFDHLEGDDAVDTRWIAQAVRVLKPGRPFALFTRWDVGHEWACAMTEAGLRIKSQVIWDKQVPGLGDLKGQFSPQHEMIWFAVKGHGYEFPNGRPTSVIYAMRLDHRDIVHPTQKPVVLMRRLLRAITPKGSIVLDPFAGSGATIIAARDEGMEGIGIEINPRYAEFARTRVDPKFPLFDGL